MVRLAREKPKKWLWEKSPGVWYVRRGGKYTRIKAREGTEDFDREYWGILSGKVVARTSWGALVEKYRQHARWVNLAGRTREDYEQAIEYLLQRNRNKDATRTTRRDVMAALEANQHRVRFANTLRTVMINLLELAVDMGWLVVNPARGARKLEMPKDRKKEHVPWTDSAVDRFRANAMPLERLIFEVGVGSVQRPADWCRFKWGDYDGQCLRLTQGKTGKFLVIPCTPHLKAALDAARPEPCDPAGSILTNKHGGPMLYRTMAQIMLKERRRLGLDDFDLHACRYRGVMELAWAGCDDDQIMAVTGHSSKDMVRQYAGIARQVTRAQAAQSLRANRYGTNHKSDTAGDTA